MQSRTTMKLEFLPFALAATVALAQPRPPLPAMTQNASAPSRVLQRGDLEILTYETEQDYDRLQELFQQSISVSAITRAKHNRNFQLGARLEF